MTLKWLLTGFVCMGFAASAGAQTDPAVASYSLTDVEASPEDWRAVDPENLVIMETSKGQILIELLSVAAPAHHEQFKAYVRDGLYDGTQFHRVIRGFMAQGGDVARTHGEDKMRKPLPAEFIFRRTPSEIPIDAIGPNDSASAGLYLGFPIRTQAQFLAEMSIDGQVESWIPHCPGVLSTARTDDPNSGNAQFFLISDEGQHLDKEYTAHGRVISGLDVVKAIKLGPDPDGYPIANPDVVISAVMAADLPEAERPKAYVQRTDTESWAEKLMAADQTRAEICDLPEVPAVIG